MQQPSSSMTIDALPAETLAEILAWYAADFFYTWTSKSCIWAHVPDGPFNMFSAERTSYAFAEVTGVCRRWRAVALGCPDFWSSIVVGPCHITEQALERSRNRPLDVFALSSGQGASTEHHRSLRMVLDQLFRIRSLQLCLHLKHYEEYTILYDPAVAPSLIDVSIYYIENSRSGNVWSVIRELGTNWVAPRLRRYKVRGGTDSVVPRASYPPMQFKTSLTQLIWLSSSPTLFSSAEDILSILRELSSLQTLHISFAHPPAFADIPTTPISAQVKLPHLRRLVLAGGMDTAVDILGCLSYPRPLQQFGILTWGTSLRAEDEINVAEFLAGLMQSQKHGEKELQTLILRPCPRSAVGVELMAWCELRSPLYFPDGTLLPAHLSRPELESLDLYLSLPEYLPESYVKLFFDGFRCDTVQSLQLSYTSRDRRLPVEWLSTAQLMMEVRTLAVTDKITPPMLAACLVRRELKGPSGRRSECYFPNLSCLRVTGLELPVKDASAKTKAMERLVAACNLVCPAREPALERLVLDLPVTRLEKQALIKLKEVVGEVLCDDVEGLPHKDNMLYRTPNNIEETWEIVSDNLREEAALMRDLPELLA